MPKILGFLLLGTAILCFCLEYIRRQQRKWAQTEGFLQLCRHLRGQISCYALPISDAVLPLQIEALEECGVLPLLKEGVDFPQALERSKGELCLEPAALDALYAFGAGLGKSYREEQIALCDYTAEELEKAARQARRDCPRREKLAGSLCLTGGLALLVLFL